LLVVSNAYDGASASRAVRPGTPSATRRLLGLPYAPDCPEGPQNGRLELVGGHSREPDHAQSASWRASMARPHPLTAASTVAKALSSDSAGSGSRYARDRGLCSSFRHETAAIASCPPEGSMDKGTITSKDLSVGALFEDFYVVPNYQREFVWGEKEVRKLLDDIFAEFTSGDDQRLIDYFVGSMVVCPREDGRFDVIDGQQRLTTFFILFCALRDFFRTNHVPVQDLAQKIAKMAVDELGEETPRFRIDLHYMEGQGVLRVFSDRADFKHLKLAKRSRSFDNLNTAYHTIREFLAETFKDDVSEARRFYGYLSNRVKIIRVETEALSRALKIFETINDRGVGLDSMDLLKNLLFVKSEPRDFDRLTKEWQDFVDLLYERKEKPLRFIRYYIYANFRVDRLYEDGVYNWFEQNKGIAGIDSNPLGFVHRLHEFAYAYTSYLDGLNLDGTENRFLKNIRALGGASRQHLMLLLAAKSLHQPAFLSFCEWTENLLCLYSIGRELGRAIEPKFARWTLDIRGIESREDLDRFFQRRYLPEFDNFRQRFMLRFDEMSDENIQQYKLKYLLAKMYQYVQFKAFRKQTDLDLVRFADSGIEVEHILPLTRDKAFKVHMAGSEEEYDRAVRQLGNLALIEKTLNASISNKSIGEKRRGFAQSDLILTRSLAAEVKLGDTRVDKAFDGIPYFESWNLKTLEQRQAMFRDLALKVWGLDQLPNFSSVLGQGLK
jgi:uncharacterized protein with ParB-like and HNH nuclease domain